MGKLKNEDFLASQKTFLIICGLWPKKSSTLFGRFLTIWCFFAAYLNMALLFYSLFTAKDFHFFMTNFNLFAAFLTNNLKITIFFFNRSKFVNLLDFLQHPMFYFYRNDLERHLRRAFKTTSTIINAYAMIAFTTGLLEIFTALFKHGRELPFDYGMTNLTEESLIVYISFYVLQGFAVFVIACSSVGLDGLLTSLMGLSAAHFKNLQDAIIEVTKPLSISDKVVEDKAYGNFDEEINDRLKKCVQLHVRVITFVKILEEVFTYTFLIQFMISTVSICASGFIFIIASPNSMEFLMTFGLLMTFLFQICLYCIFGDRIIQQSLKVRDACYMSEWVNCGPKVRKTLFILMERSKRPSVLTAGKFFNLSLSSLLTIFRSAFSYETVLQQLYK